ncbi:hypothetical protein BDD12DRAFT_903997 [Trichophaea hybrida]|nr:hypothetical protein BDD12DRAFT_903997 [Trichophaea hybrida]
MPGALLADEMGLGKTHTSLAAAMFCKLQTEKVVFGQPLSFFGVKLWMNGLIKRRIIIQQSHQRNEVGPLTKKNPVPRQMLEIKTKPPSGHPCLVSAHKPIWIVTCPGFCETFKSVINDMFYNTDFTIIDLLDPNHYNLTNEDLNACADEPGMKVEHPSHIIRYLNGTSQTEWSEATHNGNNILYQQLVNDISLKVREVPTGMHRWRLACFSLVFGDMEDKNVRAVIQSWSEIDDLSEPPRISTAELEKDLPEAEEFVSSDPPPQKAVLFIPLPGQVRHLQW